MKLHYLKLELNLEGLEMAAQECSVTPTKIIEKNQECNAIFEKAIALRKKPTRQNERWIHIVGVFVLKFLISEY